MSFPRYERYSLSDIPWIEELPEGWKTQRLKTIFQLMARPVRHEDEIITAFRDGEVTLRNKRRQEGFTNALQEIGYQGIRLNDLVIHAMDAFAGAIGVSDSDGKSTPVYSVCRPLSPATSPKYYGRLLRYMALSGYINSLAKGIRERSTDFRWSDAGNVLVPVPSAQEQASIVRFIEQETANIDGLIEEQQRLIELLKEKRQAVISHAVTKGLNPDALKTTSQVDEIGEIPSHWKILRVRHVSVFTTSGPRGWSERINEFGRLFVQSGDLGESLQIDFDNCKRVNVEDGAESARTLLANGDIVVCITGAKTGNVAVCEGLREPAFVNQHLCLIRTNSSILPRFLGLLLKSTIGQTYFEKSQYGMKQGLSLEDVREAPVLLPPISEQREILSFLDSEAAKFDELYGSSETAIHLLQERRTTLISAAVTGRIDVRNYTPKEAA